MSSMLKDPFFIQRSIFTFFAAKMPRDDILADLLRAHEHKPNFFPRVDYRDVDFWLKSFEEGNFDLEQVPTYAENATLVNLPVIESIIHMGNIKEQRKGTECEVTKDGETIQSKTDFITSSFEDFKQAIQHVNTKIRLMVILCEKSVDEEHQNKFYCSVVSILSSLKFKIHVEKLGTSVWTPNQVLSILSEIDQSNFTSLDITCNDREKGFVMDDIILQPFWPKLKCFALLKCPVSLKLETVQHIPKLTVSFSYNFTDEEMKRYKDYILKLPNFGCHGFRCVRSDKDDFIRWEQALKPFTPIFNEFGEELPRRGRLSLPDGKFISFDFMGDILMFN
ncbi:hypothetical protein CAEBREN_25288 [Caenorhabditis brenneri]|uniref:DUF38 domain-containing protein n=1 Tax=Caenorhabditis brenneri TaxID=135651 RepID=G0MT01_CAEBE|nr:hypothetical protein CAEBREN_25288 [Caenorhabditis brenneri]